MPPVPILRIDDDEEVGLDAEAQKAAQGGVDADDERAARDLPYVRQDEIQAGACGQDQGGDEYG